MVAGGCEGWCVYNPAIKSAEMYNPEDNSWTTVSNLPVPLSNARMDHLDGIPTIIGGFDNQKQNGVLYQYFVENDEWRQHPSVKLRIPRSKAAVFQVPQSLFNKC